MQRLRPSPRQLSLLRQLSSARLGGPPARSLSASCRTRSTSSHAGFPRAAQPSIWTSLIPTFLRRDPSPTAAVVSKAPKSREWNPATFFIVIFLLIGSQAIQMIALRSEFAAYSRRADVRIGLLKEVIERVQRGEDVDVEGLLGTGNKAKEKEWEEVLREIEEEDKQWQSRAKKSREDSNVPGEASAISKSSDAHIKDFGEPDRVPLDDGTTTKKSGPGHPRFY